MKKREHIPKIGDEVWIKLPTNAKIIRYNKKFGYTLKTPDGVEWCYFSKDEFNVIQGGSHEKKRP